MKGLVHMYTDVFGNEFKKKKNRKCVKYVKKKKNKQLLINNIQSNLLSTATL